MSVSACTCPAGEECTINGDCVCGNGTVRDGSACVVCDPSLGTYNTFAPIYSSVSRTELFNTYLKCFS